jgi:hypothetical protein
MMRTPIQALAELLEPRVVEPAPQKGQETNASLFVLLFELKSGRAKGASVQLRNGKLIADYLLSVAKLHGAVAPWPEDVHFRGIVLARKSPGIKPPTGVSARAPYRADTRCEGLSIVNLRPGSTYPLTYFCD